jgi:hypothetical protein
VKKQVRSLHVIIKKMRSRIALVMALLFGVVAGLADTPMTKLQVQVTTMGGRPVERAEVIVRFVKGRSVIKLGKKMHTTWEVRTNQDGLAKVPEVPQGTILIQVNAKGYQTYGQTFEVDATEKTIEVKLNSPQEQYSAH